MVDKTEPVPPGTGPAAVNSEDEHSAVQHKEFVEALIPKFKLEKLLNQGRILARSHKFPNRT